eukprot:scaffold3044_cov176-Ochromonas_danica.AAC.21
MLAKHQYADVPSAVRELTDKYGLRVVVDGSHPVLDTPRCPVCTSSVRSWDSAIDSIISFDLLKKYKLDNALYQVLLDGCPAKYMLVQTEIVSSPDDAVVDGVNCRLISVLNEAVEEINDCGPNMGRSTILTRCSGSVRIALARSTSPTRASMSLAASTFRLLELQALSVALQQAQWAGTGSNLIVIEVVSEVLGIIETGS